jgi:nucleoside-diphosphate-sugar epimerase
VGEIHRLFPHWKIKTISRSSSSVEAETLDYQKFREGKFDRSFFADVSHVVHLAGLAHKFKNLNLEEIKSVNIDFFQEVLANLNLKILEKLVVMSSYSVSLLEQGVVLDTIIYAVTKQKAEEILKSWFLSNSKTPEVIILRPPMVYGKGAPGNFGRIIKLLNLPIPLPLGSFRFPRSFIQINNLTSALVAILCSPKESGISRWEISDPWVETFSGFIQELNISIQGKARIFSFPLMLFKIVLTVCGKKEAFRKLILSYQIDPGPFIQNYDWKPPVKFLDRFKGLI